MLAGKYWWEDLEVRQGRERSQYKVSYWVGYHSGQLKLNPTLELQDTK